MGVPGYEVTSATLDDIQAILDLQEQNLRINGGALSVRFSREWFEKAIVDMPIVVARSDENVVGYVVSTPLTAQAHEPIIQAMLRAYPGSPSAAIGGAGALGHHSLKPNAVNAGVEGHAAALDVFAELDCAVEGVAEKTLQRRLALDRRLLAVVLAVEVKQIEGDEDDAAGFDPSRP